MLGRTPAGTTVVQPIQNGIVSDFHATEVLLKTLLKNVSGKGLTKPKLLVCIPSDVTEAERRAVQESARAAGGKDVLLLPSAMASAIGVGLPVQDPVGSMVIDIGGGRTEVAVISLGGMVVRKSIPIAGDAMEQAISEWLLKHQQLTIGERTSAKLKLRIGSAVQVERPQQLRIRGRDLISGSPKELALNTNHVAMAMAPAIKSIQRLVADVLAQTPPELSADIMDRGIMLCGGGSQLPGMGQVLRLSTGLPVLSVENPGLSAVLGAAALLENLELLDRVIGHL
jgi:rod shape-determining protein MreB